MNQSLSLLLVLFLVCLDVTNYGKRSVPGREKRLLSVRELSFLRSQVILDLSPDSASKALHSYEERPNRAV